MVLASFSDNTHIAQKTRELLKNFQKEVWNHSIPHTAQIWHPIWVPNTFQEQGFFSNSDVETDVENFGRDFYQAGLNKLVLHSDKLRNRFGDYVEKVIRKYAS
ncbi:hypothetical protein AVEN_206183-1 [Araneus ventricosus]|uniref:Uncharacterized protein n=1 Tax=Araneus ventricosus TaxID=182803 RepID=A0A4Y2EBE8_ARAVE|nr:hypothetical protein AVEN_206183-1 [Araneus ventricosus]